MAPKQKQKQLESKRPLTRTEGRVHNAHVVPLINHAPRQQAAIIEERPIGRSQGSKRPTQGMAPTAASLTSKPVAKPFNSRSRPWRQQSPESATRIAAQPEASTSQADSSRIQQATVRPTDPRLQNLPSAHFLDGPKSTPVVIFNTNVKCNPFTIKGRQELQERELARQNRASAYERPVTPFPSLQMNRDIGVTTDIELAERGEVGVRGGDGNVSNKRCGFCKMPETLMKAFIWGSVATVVLAIIVVIVLFISKTGTR